MKTERLGFSVIFRLLNIDFKTQCSDFKVIKVISDGIMVTEVVSLTFPVNEPI